MTIQIHRPETGVWFIAIAGLISMFGNPHPGTMTFIQYTMAVCLALAASLQLAYIKPQVKNKLHWCTAYLAIVPLLMGIASNYGLGNMMRDYLPFAYVVLLPVLIMAAGRPVNELGLNAVLISLFALGMVSAVHALYIAIQEFGSLHEFNQARLAIFAGKEPEDLARPINLVQLQYMYGKAIDPAILFSAIYMLGDVISELYRRTEKRITLLLKSIVGILCVYSFVVMGIRLYLFLLVVALLIVVSMERRKNVIDWSRAISILVVGVATVYLLFWDQLVLLLTKFVSTGTNGRAVEWEGVIRHVFGSVLRVVAGEGWGATWSNPILGTEVRFTHSFLSFLLLKTGVLGLLAMGYIIVRATQALCSRWACYDLHGKLLIIAGTASAASVLFHTTYKSFSTGIILVLLVLVYQSSARSTGLVNQQ